MQLATDKILAEQSDAVGWITINNPQRRNAISLEMWQALGQAFEAFGADSGVRCVVMKGAGEKAFASGADISQFEKHRADAEAADRYGEVSLSTRRIMMKFEKPLFAMIRGYCMGGGLGIAMTADIRIAADDAVFGIPAARLGIAYDFTNMGNLVKLVGPSRAKEILITARRLSATEARAIGLVNSVVPVDELDEAVEEITTRVTENAPLSMKASKLIINEVVKDPEDRNHELIGELSRACFDSDDYREGREAFMEKRKPVFRGS